MNKLYCYLVKREDRHVFIWCAIPYLQYLFDPMVINRSLSLSKDSVVYFWSVGGDSGKCWSTLDPRIKLYQSLFGYRSLHDAHTI